LIFERLLKCVEETPVFASFLARLWYPERYQPQVIRLQIVTSEEKRCRKDTKNKRNAVFLGIPQAVLTLFSGSGSNILSVRPAPLPGNRGTNHQGVPRGDKSAPRPGLLPRWRERHFHSNPLFRSLSGEKPAPFAVRILHDGEKPLLEQLLRKRARTGPRGPANNSEFHPVMNDRSIHPNTKVMLDAWRRMNANSAAGAVESPRVEDHPGLIDRLFVLENKRDGAWLFRTAGTSLTSLLGRPLVDHDYLNLWSGPDKPMMSAFLDAVQLDGAPGVIRGRGETLTGQRVEIELTLMPLAKQTERPDSNRLLGLYQTLGGEPLLKGRPVWRHRVSMLVPPDTRVSEPRLKLIASNG
jgi:hypothetical protein